LEKAREHSAIEKETTEIQSVETEIATTLILLGKRIPRVLTGEPTEIPLLINGESFLITLESLTPLTFTLNGRRFEIRYEDTIPVGRTASSSPTRYQKVIFSSDQIAAPIAGVVSSILCKVGEQVCADTVVLRLEAMKMQNGITAGKDGVIKRIFVAEGQEVGTGEALFEVT
jgi:biotin carboxyl carrier protein